jgi:glycosyltransferase involved in cell wall biosynthesis
VVDNNSKDNTAEVARKLWQQNYSNIPFSVVFEPVPGLSYARNKGYQTAKYDLLIFCDDDNWLEKSYLQTAFTIMQENENIGILGGRSTGAFETVKPRWFDNFQWAYAIGNQLEKTGIANARRYVTGAGMVIRKQILDELASLNFQSVLSGRKGDSIASGEDSELCILCRFFGYDLYYDERLQFTHFITSRRLQWSYCVRMVSEGFAIPQIYFYMYEYCFDQINQNKKPSFSYAYKRNLRKPFKELVQDFNSVKKAFNSLNLLMKRHEGAMAEIKLKAKINKLKFALKNKQLLKEDFAVICKLLNQFKLSGNN